MDYKKYETLANSNNEPTKCILNLDWKNGGSHWVAVKTVNKNLYYYDPFGVSPPFKHLQRNIIWNTIKDQELNEQNCGWRCLYALLKNEIS